MTCFKNRWHYVVYYCVSFGFIAFSFLFALLSIFFHYPEVASSKGDQIMLEKQKPYILFKQQPDNLPHFCRGFRVIPQLNGRPDGMIVQVTTSRERPVYSNNASTYSFTEDIYLEGPKTGNVSYYLPSSSRVDITSCGQEFYTEDTTLTIPIFNNYGKMKKWLNSKEQDPESPDVILYAQFPPCPSMTTVSFNTSGFSDGTWYFLLGIGRKSDEDDFSATLDLQFTKHLLEMPNPIDNCTADADDYCELDAPTGNDVYLLLEHSLNSTYPYAAWIRVFCYKYDPYLSVMYFLVLPLGMSVCSLVFYCIFVYFGYSCQDEESRDQGPDLPGTMYCDAGTWRTRIGSSNGDVHHSSLPDISPPDYRRAVHYPNGSSTEIYQDDSSLAYLSALYDLDGSSDITMVTDADNPPAYDSLSPSDDRSRQGGNSGVEPPPGETVTEVSTTSVVTRGANNPPPYDTATHPPEQLAEVD